MANADYSSRNALVACGLVATTLPLPACSPEAGQRSGATPPVTFELQVAKPASGLVGVRVEIPRATIADASSLVLRFRDLRRNPTALKDLHATSNGETLLVEVGPQEDDLPIRLTRVNGSSGSVVITYTVDPTLP